MLFVNKVDGANGQAVISMKKRSFIALEPSFDIYNANGQFQMAITRRMSFGVVSTLSSHITPRTLINIILLLFRLSFSL